MARSRVVAFGAALLLAAAACAPPPSPTPRPPIAPTPSVSLSRAAASGGLSASPPRSAAPAASFDPTGLTVHAQVVLSGLASPVDVTNAGDGSGRLFVVEQPGRIQVVRDGRIGARPFLDIVGRVASGGERGLLGLAFHPGFPGDPRFFVDYTDRDGNTVVSSFRVSPTDPDQADPSSERILLQVIQPYANHNGGAVEFGPDGRLYVALGDGGSEGDPQGYGRRLDTLLAKILRIDIDDAASGAPYSIPADNPFLATAGARPEIWLTGLRNPWRMRFDRATGDLWIGDVGQNLWEEIDVARAGVGGLDYGWNTMEGSHCYHPAQGCDQTGLTLPVAEYGHDAGCAVIGGVVVRDARQGRLDGGYLFGDACSDALSVIDPAGAGRRDPVVVGKLGRTLSSIGEDETGAVYATSLGQGELLRLAPGS